MSTATDDFVEEYSPADRLDELFDEIAELTGQRNAIDGRLVEIAAELDSRKLWGMTGTRSLSATLAWKTGCSPRNADTLAAIAQRIDEFPRCVAGLREGRLSADQVGIIAERAGQGSDDHYAELAAVATVSQLRTAIKLEPRPNPERRHREPSITKHTDDEFTTWRITLPNIESAKFEAGLKSDHDGLINDWKHDHDADSDDEPADGDRPPMPTRVDAFLALVEAGWDADATRRPHGQHTTVVVHLDIKDKIASLHLGPVLSSADRRYVTCDATCEVWFERNGRPIGAGRNTRTIGRRLRRALEHRHPTCAVPGCGATRGLHAHHIRHWEDGGETELNNLVLVCPHHHRMHHRGEITITGPADRLVVTDADGDPIAPGSLARPPTGPPPNVPPCRGPLGERAQWWWYDPFEPQPPQSN
ncbi:HNH endonuclease signature motif containing protein [Mycobacterium sp. pV006]|uniref:HNH endonuclease signature motif containing protein n=1 Tax=Mycobacterium sp. pV006 TaxID=3238983 RepID=UPI00351B83EB